jgi:non-ribosomal peptide synthase protein (TIGR01720 family)
VLLDAGRAASPGDALRAVKEQLRTVPDRGIGYGLLRYLSGEPELGRELASLPQAEVRFNYLGQFDQALPSDAVFKLARESSGQSFSLAGHRSHLFDINCRIVQDELRIEWTFSECRHDGSTVAKLVQAYLQALRELIAHAQSPDAGGYVPSDFPTARLSQAALDRVLNKARGR